MHGAATKTQYGAIFWFAYGAELFAKACTNMLPKVTDHDRTDANRRVHLLSMTQHGWHAPPQCGDTCCREICM
jgi:hypothetical protein